MQNVAHALMEEMVLFAQHALQIEYLMVVIIVSAHLVISKILLMLIYAISVHKDARHAILLLLTANHVSQVKTQHYQVILVYALQITIIIQAHILALNVSLLAIIVMMAL